MAGQVIPIDTTLTLGILKIYANFTVRGRRGVAIGATINVQPVDYSNPRLA